MIAVGYARRSAKSEDNTVSLQEQERQIREYCDRSQMTLARIVAHDGISGAKRSRFTDINNAVQETQAKALVIYNLDRLARDCSGLLEHLRGLAVRGVVVHEVGQGALNLSKPTQLLTVSVRGAMDEFFRATVAEKTKDALGYKRQNGLRYTNIPPFGFSYLHGKLVQDSEEQRALTIISSCRLNGFGARRTRRELVQAGYHGRMGVTTIHRLLKVAPSTVADKVPANYFSLIDNN